MNLLKLDEYSLWEIFSYLHIQEHYSLARTCKKLYGISKKSFHIANFEKTLQCQLINGFFGSHNRDDIELFLRLKGRVCTLLFAAKHLLHVNHFLLNNSQSRQLETDTNAKMTNKTLKNCSKIDQNSYNRLRQREDQSESSQTAKKILSTQPSKSDDALSQQNSELVSLNTTTSDVQRLQMDCLLNELILISAKSSLFGVRHLSDLLFNSRLCMNHWYTFDIDGSVFVYICWAKHPDYALSRSIKLKDIVIGICQDTSTDELKCYCYGLSQYDFDSILKGMSDLSSPEILQPLCTHIKKLFTEKSKKRKITPELLVELASFSDWIPGKDVDQLGDGSIDIKSNSHDQRNPVNSNELQQVRLTETLKVCQNMREIFAKETYTLLNDNWKSFIRSLFYISTVSRDTQVFNKLIDFTKPVVKLLLVFNYGERLPYLPVVKCLLENSVLSEKVLGCKSEKVLLYLSRKDRLELYLENLNTVCYFHVKLNEYLLFHWKSQNGTVIMSDKEEIQCTSDVLVRKFEEFIELNFRNTPNYDEIPVISMKFIIDIFDDILMNSLSDIIENIFYIFGED